jgi:hypothetical protein
VEHAAAEGNGKAFAKAKRLLQLFGGDWTAI